MRSILSSIGILFSVCILSLHILLADALPAPPGEHRDMTSPSPLIAKVTDDPAPPKQIAVGYLKGRTDSLVFMCRGYHVWTLVPGPDHGDNTLTYRKLTTSEGRRDAEGLGVMIAPLNEENINLDNGDAAMNAKLLGATGHYDNCQWMIETINYLTKASQEVTQKTGLSVQDEERIRAKLEGVIQAQLEKDPDLRTSDSKSPCGPPLDRKTFIDLWSRPSTSGQHL
ncbi:hypothetical protein FB446DRAFT_349113 [Lentinula raphanica]|nr:hypothetical protein FB446DRAFT_349113 [Lentinula raphanica]